MRDRCPRRRAAAAGSVSRLVALALTASISVGWCCWASRHADRRRAGTPGHRLRALMLPPWPATSAHVPTYLGALGQALGDRVSRHVAGRRVRLAARLPGGARNVVASRVLHFLARRALDTVRSVDTLIWALIWINVVGLGPFAGALAIASTDLAALAKLMSEAIPRPRTRGRWKRCWRLAATWLAVMRFGILPQVLPVFASQGAALLRIEHALGDDHRGTRRRRGDRAVLVRNDPRAGVARGGVPHPAGSGDGGGDRRCVTSAARGDHGSERELEDVLCRVTIRGARGGRRSQCLVRCFVPPQE